MSTGKARMASGTADPSLRALHRSSARLEGLAPDGPITGSDVEDVMAASIRRLILSGRLPPGTKLAEEELAEIYYATRSRVRLVLQKLAHEYLVELIRNRGAFVSSPTEADARELFSARRMVERVTTEITCRTIMTHQIEELRAHLQRQERAMASGARHAAVLLSGEFHSRIARLAGNRILANLLDQLISRTALIMALRGSQATLALALANQSAILDLMVDGDSGGSSRAMERYLFTLEDALSVHHDFAGEVNLRTALGQVGYDDSVWSGI